MWATPHGRCMVSSKTRAHWGMVSPSASASQSQGKGTTFLTRCSRYWETVCLAVEAADQLEKVGVATRVLSMHTIRPFDREALIHAARNTRALITVEEHSVHGGLGEACASILLEAGLSVPFQIVGIPDEDTVTGTQQDIFKHYGITATALSGRARNLLERSGASIGS